jgi:holo-[acyl-carrier-protein] synthase
VIISVGIDSADFRRFEYLVRRVPLILPKLFLPSELSKYSLRKLCGSFVAKEAFFKAIGNPRLSPHNMAIVRNEQGRPEIVIEASLAKKLAIHSISLSLTDCNGIVTGIVVIERFTSPVVQMSDNRSLS